MLRVRGIVPLVSGTIGFKISRAMSACARRRYVGTSSRGLTKEFSFSVPWGHVSGKTWGSEKCPPIVCLHGWLDNCNAFDKLIPLLPEDYYYVAFDTPGHGLSSHIKPGMFYFTLFYCAVVKRLLEHFNFKEVTMLGHSMGGNVGAYFAGLYPEIVHSFIVIDAIGLHFKQPDRFVSELRSCLDSYLTYEMEEERTVKEYTYEGVKERLKAANPKLTEEAVEILLERGTQEQENGLFTLTRDMRHNFRDANERDFSAALSIVANINAHVLMIRASDGMIRFMQSKHAEAFSRTQKEYEKSAKSLQIVEVEGNHHVHLCEPEQTAKHISDFLNDLKIKLDSNGSANL